MAQTKRKRRSKHRGTAGGTVVHRGRTGRKPTDDERKKSPAKGDRTGARLARYDKPPTWKGALVKGAVGMVFFLIFVVVFFKQPVQGAIAIALFVLVLYTVLTYYTDLFIYRRRQKRKAGR